MSQVAQSMQEINLGTSSLAGVAFSLLDFSLCSKRFRGALCVFRCVNARILERERKKRRRGRGE